MPELLARTSLLFVDEQEVYALAANNQNQHETTPALIANLGEIFNEEDNDMDETKVNELIAAALAANAESEATKLAAAVTAAEEAKDATIAELTTKLAEAEAKVDTEAAAKLTEAETKLAEATTALAAATDFIKDEAKKAQVAAGNTNPVEVATLDEGIAKIKESGLLIAKLYAKPEDDATTLKATDREISPAFRRAN